jgi:hypothetical protein
MSLHACGPIALQAALELAGLGPVDLDQLTDGKSKLFGEVHSLEQLETAAKQFGAITRFVWLDPTKPVPPVPIIICLTAR